MTDKKIIMKGIHSVYNCDTFFYLKNKKETKKCIIYEWDSFCVGSINSYSYMNWSDDDIYKGFQAIYGYSKQEVRDELLYIVE